jgi:hypothetical protein
VIYDAGESKRVRDREGLRGRFARGLQHSIAGKRNVAMQLSTVVASVALVLAAALAVGHALGQEDIPLRSEPSVEPKVTMQKRVDEREAQRRAAAADQQKKRDQFARQCNKPVKTPYELEECRSFYRQM